MKIEFLLFRLLKIKFAGRVKLKAVRDFIYALLLLMLVHNNIRAQVYPVQATPQLIAPYSLYLSDYVAPASERLVLNVMLNDISKPAIDVRFRLRIIGQSITIETKQEFMPPPVQLHGGIPLRLISADLADYFDPQNLNFTGITRREYEQRGKLPEGAYQFCFEVLEYNRGVKISNTGCATAWMILNDPPIINLPMQNAKVIPTSPQNVIFQWTPRHTGSPNAAFTTEYDIKMVEVWPATRQPNDAMLTSPPIFEATTQSTTLIYGPAETPLELGRRYAFRVQAKSLVGIDQLDLFKNNGYSEVFTFVYGDACSAPTDIEVTTLGSNRFSLQWTGQTNHTAFKVQYRPAGTQNWYDNITSISNADIYSLKPSTTYEYQVSGTCGFFDGIYSSVATVKTRDEPPMSYSCGLPLEKFSLDPSELAPSLKVGDVIHAGDFNVELTKVSGGNGVFSGEGILPLSFFNKAKVKAEFTNATINKDLRLVSGYFNVTGAGVDIVPAGLANLMEKLDEAINIADSALSLVETMIPDEIPNPASFVADTLVTIQGEILAVVKNPISGKVIVTTTTGQTQELSPGTSYAVTDSKGKGYLVDSNGNVGKTTAELAKQTAKREYNLMLAFNPANNTVYGYDKKSTDPKYNALKGYEVLKDGYSVPWKAVATGSTDYVQAELSKNDIDKTRIHFELEGTTLSSAPMGSGNTTSLVIPGHVAGVEEDLTAVFNPSDTSKKSQLLGKMKVIAYNGVNYNLVLIPVNTAEYPSNNITNLKTQLNTIYAQAAVSWNITLNGKLSVDLDDTFDDGSSGLLSNYTSDMNKVINAYSSPFVANTYYLFLVQKPASGKTLGFMPRSKQTGFIFVDMFGGDETKLINTIAHELGHGAFTLKHSFDSDELNLPKGGTDNLMDYAETPGSKLLKYQWDRIHNPVEVLGMFEEDAKAQMAIVSNLDDLKDFANPDGSFSFLTPAGKIITLPPGTQYVAFSTADNWPEDDGKFVIAPIGTLIIFKINNQVYKASRADKSFLGYKGGEGLYKDILSVNQKNNISPIVGFPCIDNSDNPVFITKQLSGSFEKVSAVNYGAGNILTVDYLINSNQTFFNNLLVLGKDLNRTDNINLQGAKPIYAQISPELGAEAIDFIDHNKTSSSCENGSSFYIYGHAQQINKFPLVYNACFSGLSALEYNIQMANFQERVSAASVELSSVPKSYDQLKTSIAYWSEKGVSTYKTLDDQMNQVAALTDKTPEYILTVLQNISPCVLRYIGLGEREILIDAVLKGNVNGYLLGAGNDKENLFLALLQNSPPSDQKALLDYLLDFKGVLFWKAYNGLDLGNNDAFINLITKWYSTYYPTDKIYSREDIIPIPTDLETRYFSIDDGNDYSTYNFDATLYPTSNQVEFQTYRKLFQQDSWGNTEFKRHCKLSPFDYVTLSFNDDYNFSSPDGSGTLESGKTITVPLIWAYWFQRRHDQQMAFKTIRIVLDIVAICSAPVSGGSSLAVLEIIVASADLALTLSQDALQKTEEGKQLYEELDKWILAFNIPLGANGALQFVKGRSYKLIPEKLADTYQSLRTTTTDAVTTAADNASKFKAAVSNIITKLGNTQPGLTQKLLGEIRSMEFGEMFNSAGNLLQAKVKNLTAAVILKGGIEYKIANYSLNTALNKNALSEIRWLDENSAYVVQGEVRNINYIDDAGKLVESGSLKVVEKADGTGICILANSASNWDVVTLRNFWNNLIDIPKTQLTKYSLFRRVNKNWEPAVTHPAQILNQVNRYSKEREAIYFGRSRNVTDKEWLAYNSEFGLRGPEGSKLYEFEVEESDLLDLTDEYILKKLNIEKLMLIDVENKIIPQELGDWAFERGFRGVIFPSARETGETNIVIFKYFEGNTPPSIKSTTPIETIE